MKKLITSLFILFTFTHFAQTCGENFYDSGGVGGEYSDNEFQTYTICSQNASEGVVVNFTAFATENGLDLLYVYNGNSDAAELIGTYSGTNNPGLIVAENPTGCLTFVFETDGSVTDIGWEASITCIPLTTCFRPVDLLATNITNISADLSWTTQNGEAEWVIEYGMQGFVLGTGTSVIATTNPFTISGLTGASNYDFYVKAHCSPTDSSFFSAIGTFQTAMDPLICGNQFLDNGVLNPYEPNSDDTYIICPTTVDERVQVVFSEFDLESGYDSLKVFNGNSTSAPQIGAYSGTTIPNAITAENPTGCLTFTFTSDGSVENNGWLADVICIPQTTCFSPSNITLISSTNSDAVISWNAGNLETEWIVEYGESGFVLGTGTSIQTVDNPLTLSSLNANTNYDFYIRAFCAVGDSSVLSQVFTFQTGLDPFVCGNQFLDNGGINSYNLSSLDTIVICPTTVDERVEIIFSEFEIAQDIDYLSVYNGNTVDGALLGTFTGFQIPGPFVAENVSGCLTFVFESSNFTTGYPGWIADINCIPQTSCFQPVNITISNVSNNSASIGWTNGNGETEWNIEYGIAGFTPGTGTILNTTQDFNILTALEAASIYEFYVQSVCGGNETSSFAGPFTFQTTLDPFICGNQFLDNGGLGNYAPNSNDEITICPNGTNETVQIVFSEFNIETNYEYLTVYNGNSTNADLIDTYTGTFIPDTIVSTDITGCLTFVFTGDGVVEYSGWVAAINCVSSIICENPTSANISNVTASSAIFTWETANQENMWFVEYGLSGFTPGTGTSIATGNQMFLIDNLLELTSYDVYVRTICMDDTLNYSNLQTFTTIAAPLICGNQFNDLNGPTENYSPNMVESRIVCPSEANMRVQIVFSDFNLDLSDTLLVYNGTSTNSDILFQLSGSTTPSPITANNLDGCLTFVLNSVGTDVSEGWSGTINCIDQNVSLVENILSGISVYPNPFKEFLTISNDSDNEVSYEINSIQGKKVTNSNMKLAAHTKTQINLGELVAGVYFISVKDAISSKTYSLIKQ